MLDGRTADFDGEHCPIVYRKDKFKMRAFECFWLSDTPLVPASKFEGQGYHNLHLDNETLPTFIIGDFNAEPGWDEMEPIESCDKYKAAVSGTLRKGVFAYLTTSQSGLCMKFNHYNRISIKIRLPKNGCLILF